MKLLNHLLHQKRLLFFPLVGIFIPTICIFADANWVKGMSHISHILHSLLFTAVIWIGCEIINYYLDIYVQWKKNVLLRVFVQSISFIIWSIIAVVILYLIIFNNPENWESLKLSILISTCATTGVNIIVLCAHFFNEWKNQITINEQLLKENAESKFDALKNQVNPHFLFNSLNTLIGIIEEDPKKAVHFTQSLSNVYRGLLSNSKDPFVSLEKEMELVNEYLKLLSMRFENALQIEITIEHENLQKKLPYLSVQMLVENCIKHNIVSASKPLHVKIYCLQKSLYVENNHQPKEGVVSNGLGLKNIMSRYASHFSNKNIEIEKNNTIFKVELPLL